MAKKKVMKDAVKALEDYEAKMECMRDLCANFDAQFGKGTLKRLNVDVDSEIKVIPSGNLALDVVLGVGGYPRGRVIEIYGENGSGKSTTVLRAIGECQRQGGVAAYIDMEHSLSVTWAVKNGVNVNDLWFAQPDSGEKALELVESIARSGAADMIVLDSVAALVPKAELDGEMTDNQMGALGRLMGKGMRKIVPVVSASECCLIMVNQVRMKIGVMFGDPRTQPGGKALKFATTIRLEIRKKETKKEGDDAIKNIIEIKNIKNKVAPPFRKCEAEIDFHKGLWNTPSIVACGVAIGAIDKSGSWYAYGGEKIGQGKDKVYDFLEEHPALMVTIEQKIREHYFHEVSSLSSPMEVIEEFNNALGDN